MNIFFESLLITLYIFTVENEIIATKISKSYL